jgi:hypothetical protein
MLGRLAGLVVFSKPVYDSKDNFIGIIIHNMIFIYIYVNKYPHLRLDFHIFPAINVIYLQIVVFFLNSAYKNDN